MAGYTSTIISQLALSHLNITKQIADVDTEKSKEAAACRQFFEVARDELLRDFPWPFATKFAQLALIVESPTFEYGFAYRYPTDCLFIRRILSGLRNDNRQSRIHYRVGNDDAGRVIYTDQQNAAVEITTIDAQNPAKWDSDFALALSYRLASYIAPSLTGGDPFKTGEQAFKLSQIHSSKAFANAKNEEQAEDYPESELIRARS